MRQSSIIQLRNGPKRMGDECDVFFQSVLETVMLSKHQTEDVTKLIKAKQFSRILVQDSTVIRLPLRLFEQFSGVKKAHTSVCNARIQGIYDLISQRFIALSIDSYSKNDLSVSLYFPAEQGDLILRDRGYFVIKAMEEFKKKGADSIFRYKHKTTLFDIANQKEINLLAYLAKNGSKQQLNVLLRARLIMIVCLNQHFFNPLSKKIKKISDKQLSMMKFMRYITKNLNVIHKISSIQNISEESIKALIRYCTYDTRKRLNFVQKMEQVILEINMIDFSLA